MEHSTKAWGFLQLSLAYVERHTSILPSHRSSAQKLHVASGYPFGQRSSITCPSQNHWAIEKENFMMYHVCVLGVRRESGQLIAANLVGIGGQW